MKIESIFRNIPDFYDICLDTILFESRYPVLFTCRNGQDVYLFICCLVTGDKAEWIGTKTTYDNLIGLLENRITIRDAFLNVTENKIIIDYNGQNVDYRMEKRSSVPENLLPAAGEYMDAENEEYAEEIAVFKRRNVSTEHVIQMQIYKYVALRYEGKSIWMPDDTFARDKELQNGVHHKIGESLLSKGSIRIVG